MDETRRDNAPKRTCRSRHLFSICTWCVHNQLGDRFRTPDQLNRAVPHCTLHGLSGLHPHFSVLYLCFACDLRNAKFEIFLRAKIKIAISHSFLNGLA